MGLCMQAYSVRACLFVCLVTLCTQTGWVCSSDSIDALMFLIWLDLSEKWACAQKYIVWILISLCAQVILCAQAGPTFSPDSIDILISLIGPNLADIWASACQKMMCMHASMPACLRTHAQTSESWPTCPPNSVDISIFPIRPNLAEILACTP